MLSVRKKQMKIQILEKRGGEGEMILRRSLSS